MKTLVANIGQVEYGWLLQAIMRLRYQAKAFDQTVVYCEKGLEYLCEDFATGIVSYEPELGWRDRWLFRGKQITVPKKILAMYPGASKFVPTERNCTNLMFTPFKYGQDNACSKTLFDVAVHARWVIRGDWIDRACGGHHNWGTTRWTKLVKTLAPLKVACVGSTSGSRHIPGTMDYRGIDMKHLCNIMAQVQVVIGESSFPMHLASMCGTPHVVITHDKLEKSIGTTNKARYEVLWNPLKTPCKVVRHEKWNPRVSEVLEKVRLFTQCE